MNRWMLTKFKYLNNTNTCTYTVTNFTMSFASYVATVITLEKQLLYVLFKTLAIFNKLKNPSLSIF